MHYGKAKKIGSAMYLNKSNGKYIPFKVFLKGADCTLIQQMLDKTGQAIRY
jgi:hypothetical protein